MSSAKRCRPAFSLKDNREDLLLGRRLLHAAEEWRALSSDRSGLLRGARLAQGQEWLANHADAPTLVREFLLTSCDAEEETARQEREAQQREIARQKELLAAQETAAIEARLSALRSRRFSYAMGVLVVIAVGAAIFARSQQLTAQSRALAAQAEQLVGEDRSQALALAIRGWRTAKTKEAKAAVAHVFPQLLATLEGHTGTVRRAAFSPDGQRIVTASDDQTALVWNAITGQVVTELRGHTGTVWHAAFSPNGQRVVTASEDKTARLWNAATGQLLAKLEGHMSKVNQVVFSTDGQRILTASDDPA